jgi:hypothetical protein
MVFRFGISGQDVLKSKSIVFLRSRVFLTYWSVQEGEKRNIIAIAGPGGMYLHHLGDYLQSKAGTNLTAKTLAIKDKLITHFVLLMAGIFVFITQEVDHDGFDLEHCCLPFAFQAGILAPEVLLPFSKMISLYFLHDSNYSNQRIFARQYAERPPEGDQSTKQLLVNLHYC